MRKTHTHADQENDNTMEFEYYIMYNWKKGGKPKIYKNDPSSKEGPYDIVEKRSVTIKKPEKHRYQSQGEINIPEGKIEEATINEL